MTQLCWTATDSSLFSFVKSVGPQSLFLYIWSMIMVNKDSCRNTHNVNIHVAKRREKVSVRFFSCQEGAVRRGRQNSQTVRVIFLWVFWSRVILLIWTCKLNTGWREIHFLVRLLVLLIMFLFFGTCFLPSTHKIVNVVFLVLNLEGRGPYDQDTLI